MEKLQQISHTSRLYPPWNILGREGYAFGTHLVDTGEQSSTIKSYFSAIKHILKTNGNQWDDAKAMLCTLTRS